MDASILGDLIPKVLELMKSSVGLGTRVACVHLIVLLSYHLKHELQPYTGMQTFIKVQAGPKVITFCHVTLCTTGI